MANILFKNEENIYCLTFAGDVAVSENLPNEEIDTGHSCRTTAQAQNVMARLKYTSTNCKSSMIRAGTICTVYTFSPTVQSVLPSVKST